MLQVFYEIQSEAEKQLEEIFYNEFCHTEAFSRMKDECGSYDSQYLKQNPGNTFLEKDDIKSSKTAKVRLENVTEQLNNKLQALEALQKSLKADSKVLQTISDEIQSLETERNELTLHVEQTESWTSNLGLWHCRVHDVTQQMNKDTFLVTLVVFIPQVEIYFFLFFINSHVIYFIWYYILGEVA